MGSTYDFGKGTTLEESPTPKFEKWNPYKTVEFAKALVAPHELLYVCLSGSHLHGTSTPSSDMDFKGIFIPNEDSCFLDQQPKHFKYSSGGDDTQNTSDDVDFEIWSIQEWVKMIAKGDSNALAVLFSAFNDGMIYYYNPKMDLILEHYYFLYDPNKIDSFIGFSKGQAVKYGVKGSRLKVLQNIIEYLSMSEQANGGFNDTTLLGELDLNEMVDLCQDQDAKDKDYLSVVERGEQVFLKVLTKEHQNNILLSEFQTRINKEFEKYGHRAHTAKDMEGKDWKALSHSLRSLFEAHDMLRTGRVTYPLHSAAVLMAVKEGRVSMLEFELAYNELEKLVNDFRSKHKRESYYDPKKVFQMVLSLYKKEETNDNSGQG